MTGDLVVENVETLAAFIKREMPCQCQPPYPIVMPGYTRSDPNCPWANWGDGLAELAVEEGVVRLAADVWDEGHLQGVVDTAPRGVTSGERLLHAIYADTGDNPYRGGHHA